MVGCLGSFLMFALIVIVWPAISIYHGFLRRHTPLVVRGLFVGLGGLGMFNIGTFFSSSHWGDMPMVHVLVHVIGWVVFASLSRWFIPSFRRYMNASPVSF